MVKASLDKDWVVSVDINGNLFVILFLLSPSKPSQATWPGVLYVIIAILSKVVQLKSPVSYKNPQWHHYTWEIYLSLESNFYRAEGRTIKNLIISIIALLSIYQFFL